MTDNKRQPAATVAPLRKAVPCPNCRRPSAREHYPFCSDRCRNVDLNRWLSGAYVVPAGGEGNGEEGEDR
ncbi:DNA gyrase inhibitor YacG [Shinella daejeonensis]|uniref:DNA gyrase inhibitor YacG n=1 Tax=Shinella daejeonensis TaxID=659017 RepID=UPI0020C8195E|nr:DNA gyrase inhibitor YacG [Shinella daejeonensis]MCP8895376.1 DNA gyrase inhibitor YacG [Shinella daejeonensis]